MAYYRIVRALVIAIVLGGSVVASANSPSPDAVCSDKSVGADCSSIYFPGGRCTPVDGQAVLRCESNMLRARTLQIMFVGLTGIIVLFVLRRRRR